MTPNQEGDLDPRPARPSPWRLLTVPALAALFAFGVALALPSPPAAEPPAPPSQACSGGEVALPPGHPPIGTIAPLPRGYEALLPPGHPPIDGMRDGTRDGMRGQRVAPPLSAPTFQQPEILDI
jgi:hypothetical protein